MNTFLELFSGVATILTGTVAIGIYFYQKKDAKIQAARVLLIEIRTAEERVNQIKEQIANSSISDFPSVLMSNSWKAYSHLFVSDFDVDEMKIMNSFYDCCEVIEDFSKRNNNFFWITTEEKARVLQQMLAKTIEETLKNNLSQDIEEFKKSIDSKRDFIRTAFDHHGFVYTPQKTIDEINKHLSKVPIITTSSCGLILKKIAKLKH